MPDFDPSSATAVFDPTSATPVAAPRRPAATGLGMIGETWNDLTNKDHPNHDPNALEQGIMDISNNPLLRGPVATGKQSIANGLFMNGIPDPTFTLASEGVGRDRALTMGFTPTLVPGARQIMEGRGVGLRELKAKFPGQSPSWYRARLHGLYNQSVVNIRNQATDEANAARIHNNPLARGAQQVLNLGANIITNPQYFLAPNMAVGPNVASRIATAGLGNATLGSASDGAAQLMDQAEGIKKDFDVQQNLTATLTAGVFGSALHSTVEVAPFIKGLFSNRGIDTTPVGDPRVSNVSPMTTDHIPINQADSVQYRQVLQHGSVDDIKAFFKGRNGPQPSWQDVNTWVEHRDGATRTGPVQQELQPAFDYESAYNNHVEQQWREQNRNAVHEHVQGKMVGWKNAPEVEVVHGPEDISDPEIKAQALKEDSNGDALGFLGHDGKVRMFSGRITDPDTASAVLFHEGLGHHGLAEKFGARLDQIIQTLLDRNVNQFSRRVDKWQKANPRAYGGDRIRAAEEVLAEDSQAGVIKSSWQDAVTSTVRQFGRKMGLKLAYSDAEVKHILAMAHDSVVNGKLGASANGFRGSVQDPNKFMFIGQKARGFDPQSATAYTAKDGQIRNEIDDSQSHIKLRDDQRADPEDPKAIFIHKLGDVLHHPELFEQYPQLHDLPVRISNLQDDEGLGGYYQQNVGPHIGLDNKRGVFTPNGFTDNHQIALHETQHAIQHIEGQLTPENGGTSKLTQEEYRTNALENEARATEHRRDMSLERRINNPPKFITRSQLAAEPDYKAQDLEGIYNALDEGYTPVTRSFADERKAALEAGFTPAQIKALKETSPGDISTRLYRLQSAANMADMKIADLNKKLDTPEWSVQDQAEYIRTLADRNYFVTRIKGERAEIARALNVSKAASSYNIGTMEQMRELLEQEGSGLAGLAADPTAFFKFARKVKDLMDKGNPKGAQAVMQSVNKPYWEQYLTSFHYNAMLSGLSTHVKAPLDMMTGIAHDIIDHTLAMPIGKISNIIEGLAGQAVKPGVTTNEVVGRMYGITRAVFDHEVYVKTLEALRTGEGSAVLPGGASVPTNPAHTYMGTANPRLGLLSKPTDLIVAQDTFFRSVSVSKTLYGLGLREAEAQLKASGESYTRDDVFTLGSSIARSPTPTMLKEARAAAEKELLLNPNRLTSWIDKVKSIGPAASISERVGSFIANNLAPFIRVAANSLITRVWNRSPLAFLGPDTRKAIAAGGPESHLIMARIAYGTVKLGLLWGAANAVYDKLTGEGPDNANKRKEWQAAGWRQDAVHEDGRYNTGSTLAMSLNPFDLHNSTAQMVASMRQAYEKGANEGRVGVGLKLAFGALWHHFESETWVDSITPAVEAASADGGASGKVDQFIGSEAKSWVPNLIGQLARQTNPNQLDTRPETDDINTTNLWGSAKNNIQAALPVLNSGLPIRYSVYGNPLPNGQSVTGVHTMIPGLQGNGVQETHDPAEVELNRLARITDPKIVLEDGVTKVAKAGIITPVQRRVKLEDGTWKHLTAREFENYQRVAGRAIVETVRTEMSTSEWQNMSDQEKVLTVRDIQKEMKQAAREELFDPQ